MKRKKSLNTNHGNPPIEVSAEDLNLIRSRETSRNRRSKIEWFSL